MTIAYKIRNLSDQLEAHAEQQILTESMLKLALDVLRVIADEVEQIEHQPVPDARRHCKDPGVVDFVAIKNRREIDSYLHTVGVHAVEPPGDVS